MPSKKEASRTRISPNRKRTGYFKRYTLFLLGLFLCSAGVSLITLCRLGTSPISSSPYVASLNTSLSMGTYIFILNALLIFGQLILLGRKGIRECRIDLLMQIPVSFLFGLFVDLTLLLLGGFQPETYPVKILGLAAGCTVMAIGIVMEVIADVTMNSGEYFVQIVSKRFKWEFGNVKLGFDISLVATAILLSFLLSGKIEGVREGTVIVAVLTGPLVKLFTPYLSFFRKWAFGSGQEGKEIRPAADTPCVITLSREYGSGGHRIGKRLARELHIPFYDKEIIRQAALESGLSEEIVSEKEQHISNTFLYNMIMQDYEAPVGKKLSTDDALFVAQSRIILRLARQGPCVIVGRCADAVLKDNPKAIHVFLHADMPHKIDRAVREYGLSPQKAAEEIERINRSRAKHHLLFTGLHWGDSRNYRFCFDTGRVDETLICKTIEKAYMETQSDRFPKQVPGNRKG